MTDDTENSREYWCQVCTSRTGGRFSFTVCYEYPEAQPKATRCPQCGSLASGREVTEVEDDE